MKRFQIQFKGNKEQLHEQLKDWCIKSDRTLNGTILELIEKHIKEQSLPELIKSKLLDNSSTKS